MGRSSSTTSLTRPTDRSAGPKGPTAREMRVVVAETCSPPASRNVDPAGEHRVDRRAERAARSDPGGSVRRRVRIWADRSLFDARLDPVMLGRHDLDVVDLATWADRERSGAVGSVFTRRGFPVTTAWSAPGCSTSVRSAPTLSEADEPVETRLASRLCQLEATASARPTGGGTVSRHRVLPTPDWRPGSPGTRAARRPGLPGPRPDRPMFSVTRERSRPGR